MTKPTTALTQVAPLQAALAVATADGDMEALQEVATAATALREGAAKRRMGIAAENKAAEIVVRAERALGDTINGLRDEGVIGSRSDASKANRAAQLGQLRDPKLPPTLKQFLVEHDIPERRAFEWLKIARWGDDEFEAMVREAIDSDERIARVDFYRSVRPPVDEVAARRTEADVRENQGFTLLRLGIHKLLGWDVDEDGVGTVTRNELTQLPDDQLDELKGLVEALAGAYSEARKARRPLKAVA